MMNWLVEGGGRVGASVGWMSNVRPEIELYLRKIINSEGEILFQSMNMRASLDSAKPWF